MVRRIRGVVAFSLLAPLALAAAPAHAEAKPRKYVKALTEVEIEAYTPRAIGTAQVFTSEGGVGSPRRGCRFGRTVRIHQVSGGADTVVATVTSVYQPGTPGGEFEGFWEATWTTPPNAFSFYAEVPARKNKKKRLICRRGVSQPVELPG